MATASAQARPVGVGKDGGEGMEVVRSLLMRALR
jgi:hypothetical protein